MQRDIDIAATLKRTNMHFVDHLIPKLDTRISNHKREKFAHLFGIHVAVTGLQHKVHIVALVRKRLLKSVYHGLRIFSGSNRMEIEAKKKGELASRQAKVLSLQTAVPQVRYR